jgi:hypothetical protein
MNKDNAAQFLPLVQALAEGKTIQINDGTSDSPKWVDFGFDDILFGINPEYYRVKPESREWDAWVNGRSITEMDMSAYSRWQKTRVREIID